MTQTVSKYLGIYLNDHHAAAIGGLELVKRSAGEHQGTELGDFLAGLRDEIEADHAALRAIMDELGVGVDRPKEAGAWVAEKAGRLKLNGQLTGSSPLTPLVELEGLSLGIEGKRLGWI